MFSNFAALVQALHKSVSVVVGGCTTTQESEFGESDEETGSISRSRARSFPSCKLDMTKFMLL
eukprot:4673615-Karenia_brevis.AAC.1